MKRARTPVGARKVVGMGLGWVGGAIERHKGKLLAAGIALLGALAAGTDAGEAVLGALRVFLSASSSGV